MRPLLLLLAGLLAGCTNPTPLAAVVLADVASVTVFGRGVIDLGVSALSGRDCSVVRLEKGQTYCIPVDPPLPERVCTRTLAIPDCWDSAIVPSPALVVGDTPPPSDAQLRYRAARWPKSLMSQ